MHKNLIITICCSAVIIIAFILYWGMKTEHFASGSSDTIVLYYSPHCPHCHNFMPTWDEFASKGKITATKVDCTKESCPNIDGYPTVLLHKKNGSVVVFAKNRTVSDLETFVNENK